MAQVSSEEFRQHFPMLEEITHLASCSQGALSNELDASVRDMLESIRQQGAPWGRWMEEVEQARTLFADLIHASADEIAIVPNASTGAFQAASTLDYSQRSGIVSTEMEFHSVGQVWRGQEARGARVSYAPEVDGLVSDSAYERLIDDTTAMVSIPSVSYKNGARLPVAAVTKLARAHGARVFVDAYQAAGVVPIDVRTLDCDYLVAGSLKYLLGLPGLAFLYVRDGVTDQVNPSLTGWFGRSNPFNFDPAATDFPSQARRMETGTPSIPSAYGTTAGLRLLATVDTDAVWEHVQHLTRMAADRLEELGARLYSPRDPQFAGPQVAVRTNDAEGLGAFLREHKVMASPRGEAVRLSFHYYNNVADVDACMAAIAKYQQAQPLL